MKVVEVNVHWKFEVKAEGNVAAGDIGVVCRGRVPGVCCGVAGFGEDLIRASAAAFSGDELVEESVEAFYTEAFMVATG